MEKGQALRQKLEARTAKIAIMGAGYVGLAAAVEAARAGFSVTAIDVDADRVAMLNGARSYIRDITDEDLRQLVDGGRLCATTDAAAIDLADVVLVCVPTPLTPNRVPDLTYVEIAARTIAEHWHRGMLISLESTTYPGTTDEMILPLLAERGAVIGQDTFLAYCPERVDPGNREHVPGKLVRVLGGVTPNCLAVASLFYTNIAGGLVPVSSTRVAELTKLFENIYRAVNIALVNETALLCDRMGLDVWEMLSAAASKPFGILPFRPGPGVGGHCIPLDPHYLSWKAKEYDFTLRFVELAGDVNANMPYFVVTKLTRLLNEQSRPLKGARILLLGVSYKRDVADVRESPALRIIDLLNQAGATVTYHDPFIPVIRPHGSVQTALPSTDLTPEQLANVDAAVLVTDHTNVDYEKVAESVPLLLDTRGVTRGLTKHQDRIRRL